MGEAKLAEIAATLRELLKWTRFAGMLRLKDVLNQTLLTPTEKLVYELSDGERSTRKIAQGVRISHGTVSNYWEKWKKIGIVEPAKREGRYQRICSLEEVGLEVPPLPTQPIAKIEAAQPQPGEKHAESPELEKIIKEGVPE